MKLKYINKSLFMKIFRTLLSLFSLVILSSCIQSEDPNAEADILSCTVEEPDITSTTPFINDSEQGKYSVTILVYEDTDVTQITPLFTLTPGATIEPASGVTQNFTEPIIYTVTSEDKKWKKRYSVAVIDAELPLKYSFEHLLKGEKEKFDTFIELDRGYQIMQWASGNGGYSITGAGKKPSDYPTVQSTGGVTGMCAKLETRSTGFFGTTVGMPIAAGNLFIGQFNVIDAVNNALAATRFGLPFTKHPVAIKGYYKYAPGKTYKEKGKIKPNVTDEADIYAVFYESDEETPTLNGSNSLTDPKIIALARPEKIDPVSEWTEFYYDFKFKEGKTIDPDKLARGVYKIALVFSSSKNGAWFNGAVGSTLYIDEVELIVQENQKKEDSINTLK